MVASFTIDRITTLETDNGDAGVADPGDTLRTKVTITNTGDTAATNTTFNDTFFGSTLVGPVNISPIAFNDSFTAVGNTVLRVGGAANIGTGPSSVVAGNLLSNDVGSSGAGTGVIAGDGVQGFQLNAVAGGTSANGGTFNINADGSFNYVSAAGFTGTDTFTYTITDAGLDGSYATTADNLTSTATVSITVTGQVWYVDSAAAPGGTGTSSNPFNTLTAAGTASGTNDYVYVKGSATGNIVLDAGEHLIGQGASLDVATFHLADAGARSTVTGSSGYTVTLAGGGTGNNEIAGINIASTAAASGTSGGISGTNFGTLTLNNATVDATSQALILSTGAIAAGSTGLVSTDSDGGTNNVALTSVTGTLNLGTGALSGASGIGVLLSGGNGSFDYNGTITHTGNAIAVNVLNKTGGTVQFDGAISSNTASDGISLTSNTGATINFAGGVAINTSSSNTTGFNATGGGTVTVTGASNTVSSGNGTAINVQNTTIGGGGMTWLSASSSGGAGSANGINLVSAGSGGFTITGTGSTAASGGTIAGRTGSDGSTTTGIGIYISNTNNVSLSNMLLSGTFQNYGIFGQTVNNFTLRDSETAGSIGNSNAADEGAIRFDNLTGTGLFEGNTIRGGFEDVVQIDNTSGTLNLTFQDSANDQSIIGQNNAIDGNDGILVTTSGSSSLTMLVNSTVFEGAAGDNIQTDATGTATHNITISNNTFHNTHPDITSGGGGAAFIGLSAGTGSGPTVTYAITGNSIRGAEGTAIVASALGPSGTMSGTILNNTIGDNDGVHDSTQAQTGSNGGGDGIFVRVEKGVGAGNLTHAVRIANNNIGDITTGAGIHLLSNGASDASGTARLEATIQNNSIDELGVNAYGGINAQLGGGGGSDDGLLGVNIENNTINLTGATNAVAGIIFDDLASAAALYFPGYAGPYTDAGLAAFHTGGEGNTINVTGTFATQVITSPNGTFASNATFVLPVPILAASQPGYNWELALYQQQAQWLAAQAAAALAQQAGSGETAGDTSADQPTVSDDGVLSQAELSAVVDAAIARWAAAGASDAQLAAMRATSVTISDLGALTLGQSEAGHILVDDDGAGWRWFIDATPGDDAEYAGSGSVLSAADATGDAGTRMDLLTVIMHELGHQIGLEDEFAPGTTDELMYGMINPGERRLPGSDDLAGATGTAVTGAFAISPINLGTLPAGQSVSIEWRHTIDPVGEDGLVGGGGQAFVDSDQTTALGSTFQVVAVDGLTFGNLVYLDANKNGAFDAGDSGIAGVTLTLYVDTNDSGAYEAGTDLYVGYNDLGGGAGYQQGVDTPAADGTGTALTATTDANGNFAFNFLAPGDYIVVVDAGNFSGGGALVGRAVWGSANDPDDNVDNDNNAQLLSGTTATKAIRLDYDSEPTPGAGNDTNNTVDLGFVLPNQAPTSTNLSGDTVNWTESGPAVLLDLGANATIADGDSPNFDTGILSVDITAGEVNAEDVIAIVDQGTGAGQIGVSGANITFGGTTIGTFSGGSSGTALAISFNANATPAAVQALVRDITYHNTGGSDPTLGNRTVSWTLIDGDGTANGGTDTLQFTSTVSVIPDAHPDVTVTQIVAGAGGDPGGPNKPTGFTITFSEPIEGFDITDLSLGFTGGGTASLGAFTPVTPGSVYTVGVSATSDGTITLILPAGAAYAVGHGGDANFASEAPHIVDNSIVWDQTGPTVTIDQAAGQADPGTGSSVFFTVVFSEEVTGFDASDVVLSGTAGATTATVTQPDPLDGSTYQVEVTGMTGPGTVVASVKSGAIVDAALNPNGASTSTDNTVTYTVPPVAQPDAVTTAENALGTGNVLADNGSGADSGSPLTVSAVNGSGANVGTQVTLASGALLTVNADGTFSYNPNGQFNYLITTATALATGAVNDSVADSFTYTLAGGNTATVTMTVTGVTSADDQLRGNSGDNIITGTTGNDYIVGLGGVDTMNGGPGNDSIIVDDSGDVVNEAVGNGTDRVASSVNYTLASGSEIELLEAKDLSLTTPLFLSGNEFAQTIVGNAGNNFLSGGNQNDTLVGYTGDDTLGGDSGNDTLVGGAGNDIMAGGLGNDLYYVEDAGDSLIDGVGGGTDRVATTVSYTLSAGAEIELFEAITLTDVSPLNLTGNEFNNTIIGNAGINTLDGAGGDDILYSFTLADHLIGGDGNDILLGASGDDTMEGGTGSDNYVVDDAGDVLVEAVGEGYDRVGTSLSYTLGAGVSIDLFEAITLTANTAINLTGNELGQSLVGNDGNNVLDGKGGTDVMFGSDGADTFQFSTALGAANVDQIEDFLSGTDMIALDNAIFAALGAPGALAAGAFNTGAGGVASQADDRVIYDAATGNLFYDADGSGSGSSAVLFAHLVSNPALSAADFLIV